MILTVLAMIYSCSDLDESHPGSKTGATVTNNQVPILPRTPSYTDDRLTFADLAEFKEYYMELDSLFEVDQDLFDSIVNTTTPVLTVHEQVSTIDEFETPISDPILRAIINPYFEFQIDDVLISYLNDDQYLVFDASNGTLKSTIRGMTKGLTIDV
jgi:hypothetical protein